MIFNISNHQNFKDRVLYLTLFIGFFGFSYTILGDSADIVRIKDLFYHVKDEIKLGLSLKDHLAKFYVVDDYADPFAPLFAYLTAYFFDDHRYYILVLGIIYGYFYAYVFIFIRTIIEKRKNHLGPISALFGFYMFLQIPIWQLNGIRFWTGTMYVLFYLLRYIYLNKRLTPILFSPFFHSSFFLLAPIIYLLVPVVQRMRLRKFYLIVLTILLCIYYLDFHIGAIDVGAIGGNAGALEGKLNAYNQDSEYFEELSNNAEAASWFLTLRYEFQKYLMIFFHVEFLCFTWFLFRENNFDSLKLKELKLIIFLGIIAYIITLHPSPSAARYTIFFNYLLLVFLIRNMIYSLDKNLNNLVFLRYRLIRVAVVFLLAFVMVVEIRNGFEFLNYALFLGNPFTIAYFGNETPLIQFYHAIFGKFAG